MFAESVSFSAAFVAGLLSFVSPCVLPLVPAYFTFITGYSLEELTEDDSAGMRAKVILSTAAFVVGFSLVFVLLGATASLVGSLFTRYQDTIRVLGGLVIILLGVHVSGLRRLKFLDFEKRLHPHRKPVHFLGTVLVGMAFGAGWSPCVGPFLGSILAIAAGQDTVGQGMGLLAVYSAGLAVPFMIISVFVHFLLSWVRRGTRILKYVNVTAGGLLVLVGVLLVADKLNAIL
jgi:cytochrome c-type biogenesis protein